MHDFHTFCELLSSIDEHVYNETFLSYLNNGTWVAISSPTFVSQVRQLSRAFYAHGVRKATTVAIISDSSPFWLMVDFALQEIGAISVPIFANIAHENLEFELNDSRIEYAFIASQEKYEQVKASLDGMKLVVTQNIQSQAKNSIPFHTFIALEGETFASKVLPEDIATIIYTSGSTGRPKGVELTHANFISQIKDVAQTIPLGPDNIALSFLPLAHIFERMVMAYYLANGVSIYFADDVKNVGDLIKEVRPTLITVVPRLLDKIYAKMHEGLEQKKGISRFIGGLAFHRADNKEASTKGLLDGLFDLLVYRRLLEALGGHVELMICGGAPLSPKVERFFTNIGVPLYQGYGLSETSPVICVNSPSAHRFRSCGKALPSVEVRLLDDGELIVRGPNVMRGYHNQVEKTAQTIVGGWLHTGDLASIDDEGYIFIKSRKKELFKTSTGKYVSAIAIEQKLAHSKIIDYAVIIADDRPYVSVLIFLDPLQTTMPFETYIKDPSVHEHIDRYIRRINRHLNPWERIRKSTLITTQPSIDNHILTPSMKVARNTVYTIFSQEIEAMYQ